METENNTASAVGTGLPKQKKCPEEEAKAKAPLQPDGATGQGNGVIWAWLHFCDQENRAGVHTVAVSFKQ